MVIDAAALGGVSMLLEAHTLTDDDPNVANTLGEPEPEPERVELADNTTITIDGADLTVVLPPISWTALSLARPPAGGAGPDGAPNVRGPPAAATQLRNVGAAGFPRESTPARWSPTRLREWKLASRKQWMQHPLFEH